MDLMQEAILMGFSGAAVMDTKELVFVPEYRTFCEENLCGCYNLNPACPPASGTVEEMKQRALSYEKTLVLQTTQEDLHDPAVTKVIALLQLNRDGRKFFSRRQVDKSIGWMPWRRKAMKDVVSCEKPRGEAKHSVIRGFLNGETRRRSCSVAGT